MAITSADILFKFSVKTGSAGDTTVGTAEGSLGKYISTTEITDSTLNNLFGDITSDESSSLAVDYRCIFVHNNHATLPLQSPVVWMSAETEGGANIAISLDAIGVTPKGQVTAQADEVAERDIAPSGESFTSPTTKAEGLTIANIAAGSVVGIWIRRSATNSAALDNDSATITVEGNTAA